ncbi:hypothetical protein [Streptomyces alboflavus]|uniref:hypothetical protein n=1 Tax=Streptomyces alboflavus TaxID=67267 RepID=UPI0005266895|nr:hypothetical protein [Streptomyces alboflavus]
MDRIHHTAPPEAPPPAPPTPSYASQVLTTAADVLEDMGEDRRVTERTLRRALTVAVAARLHRLPTAVVNAVVKRVWEAIPAGVEGNTHHVQAQVLRGAARGLR